ncbi:hypothetical protein CY652_22420 [Burkholderia sp. WAC0059]|uniref:hypothetical protein n=1 Tax=Burkholderia sp. WAC0059 TaxID=2066022 RepID=UPI000C7E87D7|nr:hypothetical protein [Burkholderia sp. WAC0059]PLZ00201.1 hypothetical protein CY652_22420 [Burkholderia sp. WAC0059]
MGISIDSLFGKEEVANGAVVTALDHQDIVVALSAALVPQRVAVLHMLYPRTDARTHRSLDSLVDTLNGHGLHQVARLIAREAHYLLFREPAKAWRAFNEIRNDSLAIGVHLYYGGLAGEAAERMLDAHAHGRE